MSFLSDLIDGFTDLFVQSVRRLVDPLGIAPDPFSEPTESDSRNRAEELIDTFAGGLFDAAEDEVIEPLADEAPLTPDNIEAAIDQAEGNAVQLSLAALGATSAIELAGATQLETHEEMITQAMTLLALEDTLGASHQMWFEKGVAPALEARVAKQTRSEFVNLQDAVELALRNKQADEGYLTPQNAPQEVVDAIGSDNPVNPDNLVEEWGIRDDNLPILEEVALEAMEFEELIETPAELGLIVPDDVLDEVLDLAGYPEDLKDFLRQVPDEIPESNRLWEERTAVEPLVQELETLAADEEITPADAVALIPSEVDDAKPALERRFANLQTVPSGSPTRSAIEGSFASGYTDLQTLEDRLDRLEYDVDDYEDVLRKTILDELDGDLQEAVGLGLLDEGAYSDLAAFAGLDGQTIDRLLRGQSFSDITEARLQEQADPAQLSVGTIVGIGESRARALDAAGVETVGDLAQADVADVEQAAQVSTQTAQDFIDQAQQRIS